MFGRRKPWTVILVALSVVSANAWAAVANPEPTQLEEINVAQHFYMYGGASSEFWDALHTPANNPVMNACLDGATLQELDALGISDARRRLGRLRHAGVVVKRGDEYRLAFPVIVGEKRAELQRVVEQAANALIPTATTMVTEIRPCLGDREEMLYHVLWSLVMDGQDAWGAAETVMKKQVADGDTSTQNKGWLMYPSHPFAAGTNNYGIFCGRLAITHATPTPRPNDIVQVIRQVGVFLQDAVREQQSIRDKWAAGKLRTYGLVDDTGNLQVYAIARGSETGQLLSKLGTQFGQEVMVHLDVSKVASLLDVDPGTAFLIVFHEVCWQLLQELSNEGQLEVPRIVREAGVDPREAVQLLSVVYTPAMPDPFVHAPMTYEEREHIKRFEQVKERILSGEKHTDLSTPIDALLSIVSAIALQDAEAYQQAQALDTGGRIPKFGEKERTISVYRVPPWPEEPSDGDVHPIHVKYGPSGGDSVEVFIHSQGKWRKLFNNSYPGVHEDDWRPFAEEQKAQLADQP